MQALRTGVSDAVCPSDGTQGLEQGPWQLRGCARTRVSNEKHLEQEVIWWIWRVHDGGFLSSAQQIVSVPPLVVRMQPSQCGRRHDTPDPADVQSYHVTSPSSVGEQMVLISKCADKQDWCGAEY
jgi:hypothetical protein